MKKVVGIIGSLRKDSLHRTLFREYQNLTDGQFEIELGDISDIPMFNQDIQELPEAVQRLGDQIKQADAVIFFSPEYNYSVPGVLKNAIDWLSRVDSKPFDRKPAAIIGASPGNVGTARMQYHLRQIGVFLNIDFLNKPEVMIGKAFDKIKDGKLIDNDTAEFLKRHAEALNSHIN